MLEEQIIEAKGRAGETGCLQAFGSSVIIANGIQVHGSIDMEALATAIAGSLAGGPWTRD